MISLLKGSQESGVTFLALFFSFLFLAYFKSSITSIASNRVKLLKDSMTHDLRLIVAIDIVLYPPHTQNKLITNWHLGILPCCLVANEQIVELLLELQRFVEKLP